MMRRSPFHCTGLCLAAVALLALSQASGAAGRPMRLRVEHREHPLEVDASAPRFSWQTAGEAGIRGIEQRAYRIVVHRPDGRLQWNSGRVRSGQSIEISYAGRPLESATHYRWTVTAWYGDHTARSASSWFETGLGDADSKGWGGAQWIGGTSDDRVLFAAYLPLYDLSYTLAVAEGSRRAAIVFAANDPRLMDARRNPFQMAAAHNQSYFKVELDLSALARAADGAAWLKVYRAGYARDDDPAKPVAAWPVRRSLINADNAHLRHHFKVHCEFGELTFFVDGEKDPFDGQASPATSVKLNPARPEGAPAHDVITFGELNEIGFAMDAGQRASFADLVVADIRAPNGALFNESLGTGHYAGLYAQALQDKASGLSIADGAYQLDGGINGAFVVADPSRNAMPMLRTSFMTKSSKLVSARLYATARGIYELYLNGSRVGNDHYDPGLSQYNRTHFYQAYDVTPLIRPGANALGAMLGEGWWSGLLSYGNNWNVFGDRQSLMARLVLRFADGSEQIVASNDQDWTLYAHGPVVYSSLDLGEVYDASREAQVAGWASPGFDDRAWHRAAIVPVTGDGTLDFSRMQLLGQIGEPARVFQIMVARSVREVRPGVFVYDLGQNIVGVPRITLRGASPGQHLVLRVAETLYPDLRASGGNVGMIMTENYRAALSIDQYVTRAGNQVFQPRFTSHGFQYLEITGIDQAIPLAQVQGVAISSVPALTASYETSDPQVNRLWSNLTWSNVDNFLTLPTDCPQRNERMGWSGDISVFSRTATYLSDAQVFLERHMRAMRDVQRADGKFTDIAPVGGGFGGVLWGSAGVVVPWELYQQYGDLDVLRAQFPAMAAYADYLQSALDPLSGLSRDAQLGDWLGPQNQRLGQPFLATAYQAYDLNIVATAARLLGKTGAANRYERLYRERLAFFQEHFLDESGRTIGFVGKDAIAVGPKALEGKFQLADTQTSYAVALALGLVDEARRAPAGLHLAITVSNENLDDSGVNRPAYSLMTGFIGTAWISDALSMSGRSDLAYRQLLARHYPSWLYPVEQGATTIWERLNGYTRDEGFGGNNSMNSFNHYSFGAVGQWLLAHSLGIQRGEPGFREFVLAPEPDPTGGLTWAQGYYDSPYGRIESRWKRTKAATEFEFSVPPNTHAALRLPALLPGESVAGDSLGAPLAGTKSLPGRADGPAYRLASGKYHVVIVH
jgi:alpha-L-rhamnosidase